MAISAKTKYPNLKFLISEKKYSQKQIAESIGITPRTFCKKLQGIIRLHWMKRLLYKIRSFRK